MGNYLKEGCLQNERLETNLAIPPYPTRAIQRGSKGTYFREHHSLTSHFFVQAIVHTDTHGVGDPKQSFPEPHNLPEESL